MTRTVYPVPPLSVSVINKSNVVIMALLAYQQNIRTAWGLLVEATASSSQATTTATTNPPIASSLFVLSR